MGYLENHIGNQDVLAFANGTLQKGVGIGVPKFDEHVTFKRGQFNVVVGRPNVGKSYYMFFYLMALWKKQGLKSDLYVAENKIYSVKIDLVQLYYSKIITDLTEKEINEALMILTDAFRFIDNKKHYNLKDLFGILSADNWADIVLIDPYNALDDVGSHDTDYKSAGEMRRWCDTTGKTIYINMHPTSEAQRKVHTQGDFKGFPCPLDSSYVEGGGKWINRADDVFNIHRYKSHPDFWMETMVIVEKVKDTKTGGKPTYHEEPLLCSMNFSSYFTINGINPLKTDFKPLNDGNLIDEIPF